jgi:hypothetical protein
MSTFRDPVQNFTFETFVAFVGALLVLPLVIKVVFGTLRTLFRMGFVRRLLFDSVVVGATALLTRDDVLDRIFGARDPQKAVSKDRSGRGAK